MAAPLNAAVDSVKAQAYRIPTDAPESDGTLEWDSTTIVVAEISGGGKTGIGYSYTSAAAVEVIQGKLAGVVQGGNVLNIPQLWSALNCSVRNIGRRGLVSAAISAIDIALWDLKARVLDFPLTNPQLQAATLDSFNTGRLSLKVE